VGRLQQEAEVQEAEVQEAEVQEAEVQEAEVQEAEVQEAEVQEVIAVVAVIILGMNRPMSFPKKYCASTVQLKLSKVAVDSVLVLSWLLGTKRGA
jgi:hypothetical protein